MLRHAPGTLASLALPAAIGLALVFAACGGGGGGDEMDAMDSAAAPMAAVDPATAGTITGTIRLDGDAPPADVVQMAADPNCAAMHSEAVMTEFVLTDMDGGLRNAFVYLSGAVLEGMSFPTPSEPAVLNQEGCVYVPHVLGLQVGQPLEILNSDQTLHNIHATPAANQEFNIGQPVQGMTTTRTFDTPEIMVPFKCDVHRWMNSYAGVMEHPYFAVSGADGSFSIGNVPPGDYTVGVWHERLGEQEMMVTVGEMATVDASFTYSAAE